MPFTLGGQFVYPNKPGRLMHPGDMIRISEHPWNQFAGEIAIVSKIDKDGKGFDFTIPEQRGHAPINFAESLISDGFNLEKLSSDGKVQEAITIEREACAQLVLDLGGCGYCRNEKAAMAIRNRK